LTLRAIARIMFFDNAFRLPEHGLDCETAHATIRFSAKGLACEVFFPHRAADRPQWQRGTWAAWEASMRTALLVVSAMLLAGCMTSGPSSRLGMVPMANDPAAFTETLPDAAAPMERWGALGEETTVGPIAIETAALVVFPLKGDVSSHAGFGFQVGADCGVGEIGGVALRAGYLQVPMSNADGNIRGFPIDAVFYGRHKFVHTADTMWEGYMGLQAGVRLDASSGQTAQFKITYRESPTFGFMIGTRANFQKRCYVDAELGVSFALDAVVKAQSLTTGAVLVGDAGGDLDYMYLRIGAGYDF
jgi:hypothetical protein